MQRGGAARQLQTSADPLAPPAVEKSGLGLASCMQLQAQLLQHLRRLPLPLFGVGGATLLLVRLFAVWWDWQQQKEAGIGRSGDDCHLHHHPLVPRLGTGQRHAKLTAYAT